MLFRGYYFPALFRGKYFPAVLRGNYFPALNRGEGYAAVRVGRAREGLAGYEAPEEYGQPSTFPLYPGVPPSSTV